MKKQLLWGVTTVMLLILLATPVLATNEAEQSTHHDNFQVTELIVDGGFEACNPSNPPDACADWEETSTHFGTPVCDISFCGNGGGTVGPCSGNNWAWFGGSGTALGISALEQVVTIPVGTAMLSFYWWVGDGGVAGDSFNVVIDHVGVFGVTGTGLASGPQTGGYVQQSIDISAYADGGLHGIYFEGVQSSSVNLNISLDDISLTDGLVAAVTELNVPHITDILIYAWQQVVPYDLPAGSPVRLANG